MGSNIVVDELTVSPFISQPPQQRAFRVLVSPSVQANAPKGASLSTAQVYPEQSTPLHAHETEHEIWYVVSGRGQIRVGDDLIDAFPGTVVVAPPGVLHQLINLSAIAFFTAVVVFTPAGPERLFMPKA